MRPFVVLATHLSNILLVVSINLIDPVTYCISVSNKRHCLLKAGNGKYYMEVGTLPFEAELFGDKGGI